MNSPRRRIQRPQEAPPEFYDKYRGAHFEGGNDRAAAMAMRAANTGQPFQVLGVSGLTHEGQSIGKREIDPSLREVTPSGSPDEMQKYTDFLLKAHPKLLSTSDGWNAHNQRRGGNADSISRFGNGPDGLYPRERDPQDSSDMTNFWDIQRRGANSQGQQFVPENKFTQELNDTDLHNAMARQKYGNMPNQAPQQMQSSRFANAELPMAEEDFLFREGQPAPNFSPMSMPAGGDGGEVPNFSGGWIDELQPRTAQMDMREGVPDQPIAQNQPPAQMPPPSNPPYDDALRQMMMNRMGGHEEMANRNLNYWDEDLQRRSRRDAGDDFWSNVGAPIAGGMGAMMKQNTAGLGEMAAGWQSQRQARTGERMNLVNMLSGRQNKSMDYMMATDPNVIKNQMGLINALANRQRADAYGQGVNNNYDINQKKLGFQQMDSETRRMNMESMSGLRDAQIHDLANKGLIDRDLANSTIAYRQAQAGHMQTQDEQAAVNETGRNTRFAQGEAGEDRRLGVRESGLNSRQQVSESGDDRRLGVRESGMNSRNNADNESRARNMQYEQEQVNQRYAAGMTDKGKAKTSDGFRNTMSVDPKLRPAYSKAMRVWNSMDPRDRKANREGFMAKFGVDPGE